MQKGIELDLSTILPHACGWQHGLRTLRKAAPGSERAPNNREGWHHEC